MSYFTLRHVVQAIAILVWARHLTGAARTFSIVKGERPPAAVQLFPLAILALSYAMVTTRLEARLVAPGVVLLFASLALFEWSRYSIRGRYFSYAYSDDTPEFVCTSGPYAYIRNPFYVSYMLSYAGAALMFPGWLPVVVIGVMALFFVGAARYEERKFQQSTVAEQYASYMTRTGRFIPKF